MNRPGADIVKAVIMKYLDAKLLDQRFVSKWISHVALRIVKAE